MRVSTTLFVGLIATTEALVTRAVIDKCLIDSGVPVDVKGSPDYIRDVEPFNIRIPYTPAAIALPRTIAHIQKSVKCGKKLGIKVSAKSGGHSYASFGLGGENGHLVVELDRMYNVTLDQRTKIATVQPGARLGHVATVLNDVYGRAISHGTCPHVGISGHFAHGGFGFSSHMHGLALDFVESVTVVLADGRIVEASRKENSDLLWAIQGAGSNFGIVASWKLRTFEAPKALTKFGMSLGWTKENAVAGLEAVEAYAKNIAPREINFRVADYGGGGANLEGLFYGNTEKLNVALAPLLKSLPEGWNITAKQEVTWIESVIGYSNYESVDWLTPAPVENFYAKSLAIKGLNGTSAQAFVDYWFDEARAVTDRFWFFQLDIHGGKNSQISKVGQDATAYAHRDKLYLMQFYDRYNNDQVYPESSLPFLDGWVDATTASLPKGDWGAYANYADPRLPRATAEKLYYMDHLSKLQKIKAKYDPKQLFYYPQGLQPKFF